MASPHPTWSDEAAHTVLEALPDDLRLILPALQALQEHFGYLPDGAVSVVARFLNVSVAEVHGVLTFYHDLRREPPAAVRVQLCAAEACQASGSRALAAQVSAELAKPGSRTTDGAVSVDEVFCLGNCALGPAAMVNERLLGRVDLERLRSVVRDARAGAGA